MVMQFHATNVSGGAEILIAVCSAVWRCAVFVQMRLSSHHLNIFDKAKYLGVGVNGCEYGCPFSLIDAISRFCCCRSSGRE